MYESWNISIFFTLILQVFLLQRGFFVFDQLKIWSELQLILDSENPYDAHAVAVYFKKTKIGYISKSE